ncbi:MAG: Gfo/Idh/MocA family protein [Thermomicrobiales bacterium]
MDSLRYGVIGARDTGICGEHIRSILRLPDAELVAVCDTNEEHLQRAAQLVDAPVARYIDYQEMLARESLDAVVIATPNFTHEAIVLNVFAAGAHVLCEKPLAPALAGCDAIIEAGRRANRLLQVGLHRRYNRLFERLQGLIDAGELGAPCMMWSHEFRGDWAADRPYDDPERGRINWRFYQDLSGGSLVEKNCHDFDVFNWFAASEPTRVVASGGLAAYQGRETIDHAIVMIDYANGFKAMLQLGLFVPHGFHGRYEGLIGTEGSVKIYEGTRELYQYFRDRPAEVHYADRDEAKGHGHGMYRQHVAFAACIREGRQPFANGEAGRASVAVAVAAEESIRTGEPVSLTTAPWTARAAALASAAR